MNHHYDRFKYSLLHLLQTGAFEEMLGCQHGQYAAIEFRLERVYHVHLMRRYVVVQERDAETVRRYAKRRWHRLAPPNVSRERIILKRGTWEILRAPRLGRLRKAPLPPATRGMLRQAARRAAVTATR